MNVYYVLSDGAANLQHSGDLILLGTSGLHKNANR